MNHFIVYFFALSSVVFSCNEKKKLHIHTYHWKLNNQLISENTTKQLDKWNIDTIYLHLMDVEWNEGKQQVLPKAILSIDEDNPILKKSIVPVIFIRNDVFLKTDSSDMALLAQRILAIKNTFSQVFKQGNIAELQIDCDWTKTTKNTYFYLLEQLKKQEPTIILSATIRLYPYKYPQYMGIPPVNYGVLMCYNMDNIKSIETNNSILNKKILQQYLTHNDYPLTVKPALPIFGWYVWFRDNNYKTILYLPRNFSKNSFLQTIKKNNFRVLKDTVVGDNYFRRGDVLRDEFPTTEDLEKSIELLIEKRPKTKAIIIYHWDELLIRQYETTLQNLVDRYGVGNS